jgi:hypothetical protein
VLEPAFYVRAKPPDFVTMSFVLPGKEASLNPSVDGYAMTARNLDDLASAEHLVKRISTCGIERNLRGVDWAGKAAAMGLRVHGVDRPQCDGGNMPG